MTILSVCQSVAKKIGLTVPTSVMASTDRELVELAEIANSTGEMIARAYDWQDLQRVATLTGDGSAVDFSLPTDYDRMTASSQVWSSSYERPFSRIKDTNQWLGLDVQAFDFVINAWIIYGGQMHIKPAMANAATAKFFYQSNLIAQPESGSNKAQFTEDTDTFRLNERLLTLGMIYTWKQAKRLTYAEEMADYEVLKEKLTTADKGARMLNIGTRRLPAGVSIAYPVNITP